MLYVQIRSPDREEQAEPEDSDDGDSSCSSTDSPPPRKVSCQDRFGPSGSALQAVTPSANRVRPSPSVSRAAELTPPQRNGTSTCSRIRLLQSQSTTLNAGTSRRESQKGLCHFLLSFSVIALGCRFNKSISVCQQGSHCL